MSIKDKLLDVEFNLWLVCNPERKNWEDVLVAAFGMQDAYHIIKAFITITEVLKDIKEGKDNDN